MTEVQLLSNTLETIRVQISRAKANYKAEEDRLIARINELKANIKDLLTEYQQYESGIKATREADEERAQELHDMEVDLKNRERKLFRDRDAFETEKKQFYQTKNL